MRGTVLPAGDPASGNSGRTARHIVLVGLPGSGKSTVAPLVAAALGLPCFDLDAEVARREGRSVAEIFREAGEAGFRAAESRATRELMTGAPAVIAAGGGWVLTDSNLAAASEAAVIVHLKVTPETAARRIRTDVAHRPLLVTEDLPAVLEALEAGRRERYERAAVEVDTELLDAERVADLVVSLIERSG